MKNIRLEGGSAGIQCSTCPNIKASYIEARNMRGPYPRGQCVQFGLSDNARLTDFYCMNDETSWSEDNISMWRSSNAYVARGVIDGNYSVNGVGVMFEGSAADIEGGLCEQVDALNQSNTCFSAYGGKNVVYQDVTCAHTHCAAIPGRDPKNGSRTFVAGDYLNSQYGYGSTIYATNIKVLDSFVYDVCYCVLDSTTGERACSDGEPYRNYTSWWEQSKEDPRGFTAIEFTELETFTPRVPITTSFCWE